MVRVCVCMSMRVGVRVRVQQSPYTGKHQYKSQDTMGQVLDVLCAKTRLEWTNAAAGTENFVTLSRQGDIAIMKPLVSGHFTRQPGV